MEKETADVVVTNTGLFTTASGLVIALMGWLANKVFRSIGHRITDVHGIASNAVEACALLEKNKADNTEVQRVLDNQATLFEQQRDDSQRTMAAISTLTTSFNNFAVNVERELGRRPTREEIGDRRSTSRKNT